MVSDDDPRVVKAREYGQEHDCPMLAERIVWTWQRGDTGFHGLPRFSEAAQPNADAVKAILSEPR